MLSGANFLLLDEPTNNLDIPSAEVLEDALADFEGTVFVSSHDRYFLDRVVSRIVALEDGRADRYTMGITATTRQQNRTDQRSPAFCRRAGSEKDKGRYGTNR